MVGVVILLAAALTFFGILWLQGYHWGAEERDLEAVFTEVGQIRAGAPVKLRGVRVGQVRTIEVDPGGQLVRVGFRVGEDLVMPRDAVVILSPETMFGDWQAEIHPRVRYPWADYPEPPEPDVLPGYALPDISQLTAEAARIAETIHVLTERVGIAFTEETAQNIADLINNIEDVTEGLSTLVTQQAESFAQVTDEVRAATQGISDAARQAEQTLVTAEGTLHKVDGILEREEVESALRDLGVIAANVRTLSGDLQGTNEDVRRMALRMDSTFHRMSGVISRLEEGEGSLGRLLQDPATAAELEETLTQLQLLLEDIRVNPRRYLRLSVF